jgi:membrane protease YdiL (CAAX protease family)
MNQILTSISVKAPVGYSRPLVLTAWLAMLLLSRLPQIILQEVWTIEVNYAWWGLITALFLLALTFIWSFTRPLRGYFLVMAAVALFTGVLDAPLRAGSLWQNWFAIERGWIISFFGERLPLVIAALALVLLLRFMGMKWRDFFLAKGDLTAPVQDLGRKTPNLPWLQTGVLFTLGLALLFALALSQLMPSAGNWLQLIPYLPAILIFALMNSFGEEMTYRAGPLSQLYPLIGRGPANWITAVWFGLGHFYGGIPSGAMGAVLSGLIGLLFGKAMLETRGMVLPVLLHLLIDTVIYAFLALAWLGT